MDITNFIPSLVKTVNDALCEAREHWFTHKEKLEKMDFLPDYLCPSGKLIDLYGTIVDIRYKELFIPCMQVKPTGITLQVSFEVDGFPHEFRFSTECNEEMVRRGFAHIFYCRTIQTNKYLETLEKINESFSSLSN